jgi:hypothetical protein
MVHTTAGVYGKNWLFVRVETDRGSTAGGECYTEADRDRGHRNLCVTGENER